MPSTTIPLATTIEVDLSGYDKPLLSFLFAKMLEIAQPIIEHYQGDLYYDAHWLAKHAERQMSFYWMPRTWGSNIGMDPSLVGYGYGDSAGENAAFFRIDIVDVDTTGWDHWHKWRARITRIHPAGAEDLTPQED